MPAPYAAGMGELIPLFPLGSPLFPGIVLPLRIFEPRYRRLVHDLLALPPGSDRRFFGVVAIRQGWEVERVAPAEALYDVGCAARLQVVRPRPDGGFRIVTVGTERFRLLDVVVGDDPPYLQAEVEWLAEEEAAEEAAGDRQELVRPGPGAGGAGEDLLADHDHNLDEVAESVAKASMAVLVRAVRDLFARYVGEVAALGEADAEEDLDQIDERYTGPDASGTGRAGAEGPAAGSAGTAALLRAVADDPRALSYLVASAALLTPEDRQALLAESATRRRLGAEARLLRRELTLLRTLGAIPVPLQQFATPMGVN